MRLPWSLWVSVSLCVSACAMHVSPQTSPQTTPQVLSQKSSVSLAGTAWQLLSFQSLDDGQGMYRVADPSLYTITFGVDGKVALRLHCNYAASTWQATPVTSAAAGALTFGPLTGTHAQCPPPSIGEQVLRDLGSVRSYHLQDGQLHMSLLVDRGIYRWRLLSSLP